MRTGRAPALAHGMLLCVGLGVLIGGFPTQSQAQATALYGVTLDNIGNIDAATASLGAMAQHMSARVYFDTRMGANYYKTAVQKLSPVAYVMGELVDSSDMCNISASRATSRATNYFSALSPYVSIWEIGNEVNGSWLCARNQPVMPKIENMFNVIHNNGGSTALTFFYEGEPTDADNCIDKSGGGNDMFTWINQKFQLGLPPDQRSAASEALRTGLNYALISWYPDQCPGEIPNWAWVYTQLASIFPNAAVGFGELGTANPQNGSQFELAEINSIYPMQAGVGWLPANYIGGVFWWYFDEEGVPQGTPIWNAINAAIQ